MGRRPWPAQGPASFRVHPPAHGDMPDLALKPDTPKAPCLVQFLGDFPGDTPGLGWLWLELHLAQHMGTGGVSPRHGQPHGQRDTLGVFNTDVDCVGAGAQ